jgi:hypothetical protein
VPLHSVAVAVHLLQVVTLLQVLTFFNQHQNNSFLRCWS